MNSFPKSYVEILTEYLDQQFAKFPNLNCKKVITFSGIPTSGKTTLSKHISSALKFPRVSVDEMSDIVDEYEIMDSDSIECRDFLLYLLTTFFKQHKECSAFVFDKGYDRDVPFMEELVSSISPTCKVYVINFELSEEVAHARIMKRNGYQENKYVKKIPMWMEQHRRFIDKYQERISLNLSGEDPVEQNLGEMKEFLGSLNCK